MTKNITSCLDLSIKMTLEKLDKMFHARNNHTGLEKRKSFHFQVH